jgi:hypothetical protein
MPKKQTGHPNGFVLFDILYEDGTQTSNRRVPSASLEGFDADAAVRAFLEAQDREIAVASGRPRGRIKSMSRSRISAAKRAQR